MKWIIILLCTILAIVAVFIGYTLYSPNQQSPYNMKLTSTAFVADGPIPVAYTCDGSSINPPLDISDVPKGAESLALIMQDPDAPNGNWVHWVVYNMKASTTAIEENIQPVGTPGKGSGDNLGYNGPCPPSGTHHYIFTVYALDTKLTLKGDASGPELLDAVKGHILDQATLTGTYSRSR